MLLYFQAALIVFGVPYCLGLVFGLFGFIITGGISDLLAYFEKKKEGIITIKRDIIGNLIFYTQVDKNRQLAEIEKERERDRKEKEEWFEKHKDDDWDYYGPNGPVTGPSFDHVYDADGHYVGSIRHS